MSGKVPTALLLYHPGLKPKALDCSNSLRSFRRFYNPEPSASASVATNPPTRSDPIRPNPTASRLGRMEQHHGLQNRDSVFDDSVPKSCWRKEFCRRERPCETNPNVGRVQDRKTSCFRGYTNISTRPGVGCETIFYETNPNEERRGSVATDCKTASYLKNT